jgi:hypothetical protein
MFQTSREHDGPSHGMEILKEILNDRSREFITNPRSLGAPNHRFAAEGYAGVLWLTIYP